MRRWLFPIAYFVLCEVLDLLYELGLTMYINSSPLSVISVLVLVAITFPALSVGCWAQQQTAMLLGISLTDSIAYNSFWPRFLGVQASIIVCTLAFVLLSYIFSLVRRAVHARINA